MRQRMKGGTWTIETDTRTVADGIGTHGEAKIIAGAPVLLEAAERALLGMRATFTGDDDDFEETSLVKFIRAAIAAAKP